MESNNPTCLGYLDRALLFNETEVAKVRRRIAEAAELLGYQLGHIFESNHEPAVLGSLIEAMDSGAVRVVIVPSLLHLAAWGVPDAKDKFEYLVNARVISAEVALQ